MKYTKDEFIEFEKSIIDKGYHKSSTKFTNETCNYFKSFDKTYNENGEKHIGYQVAISMWDFSKYDIPKNEKPIGIGYRFILGNNNNIARFDVVMHDDKLDIVDAERISNNMYELYNEIFK